MTEIADQPPPTPNGQPAVWDLVIADMRERDRVGRERYSTPLQPLNGRDALVDAYQEALDLAVYLRQAIAERDDGTSLQCPARAKGTTGEVRCTGPTDHQGQHASWDGTGILMRWPDETSVAPDGVHKCPRCGSMKWVGVSLDGGYSRRAQCVPCGHVHARLRHVAAVSGVTHPWCERCQMPHPTTSSGQG